MIAWNPLVNTRISLDGDINLKDGYLKTLQFNSGKESRWLTNSFVPRIFPSLKLALDNKIRTKTGNTEFEEFIAWYNKSLRYGVLPFQLKRLGYTDQEFIMSPEIGIYTFIANSLNYDRIGGITIASFGLEEIGVVPEVTYAFLVTNNGEILLTGDGRYIIALGA